MITVRQLFKDYEFNDKVIAFLEHIDALLVFQENAELVLAHTYKIASKMMRKYDREEDNQKLMSSAQVFIAVAHLGILHGHEKYVETILLRLKGDMVDFKTITFFDLFELAFEDEGGSTEETDYQDPFDMVYPTAPLVFEDEDGNQFDLSIFDEVDPSQFTLDQLVDMYDVAGENDEKDPKDGGNDDD
jgi:hypothetical protein